MQYIHKLTDLHPKNAEIESVQIIRHLKKTVPKPFMAENVKETIEEYFVSPSQIHAMHSASDNLLPVIDKLNDLGKTGDPAFEIVNFQRTIQILRELPENLSKNITFSSNIAQIQLTFPGDFASTLNSIQLLRTDEQKEAVNNVINNYFEQLRCKDLVFDGQDIIGQMHIEHLAALERSMDEGFLFHVTLEEHLNRLKFADIQSRINPRLLNEIENLRQRMILIKKGVDAAYLANLNCAKWSIVMYSYIKWTLSQ